MKTFAILATLSLALAACAQDNTQPSAPTINVQSNLVLVPTLVRDAKGEVLYGLKPENFVLKDNGIPQKVHLEDEAETSALSMVVVVQCSRSAWQQGENLRGLPVMVESLIGGADQETAVVTFGTDPSLLSKFTRDPARISATLEHFQPCDDGGASIYDAVDYAARLLETREPHRRRAILLISETRDHGSLTKPQDVIARLGRSNVVVDAVSFLPGKFSLKEDLKHSDGAAGGPIGLILMAVQAVRKNASKEFARLSGGEYMNFTTQKAFDRNLNFLTNHVHNGYMISFQPHGDTTPGMHKITVEVPDYKSTVRHRESYYYGDAPAPAVP